MESRIILTSMIASLIALSAAQTVYGDNEPKFDPQFPPLSDSVIRPSRFMNEKGTSDLQEIVLMQINDSLIAGRITPARAAEFKEELNRINDKETLYKSLNSSIPEL